jgi:hypothetical protein
MHDDTSTVIVHKNGYNAEPLTGYRHFSTLPHACGKLTDLGEPLASPLRKLAWQGKLEDKSSEGILPEEKAGS